MAGYSKPAIGNYVSFDQTSSSITVYISSGVSSIFDNVGADRFNVSCGSKQSGIVLLSRGYYRFTGLDADTSYSITIDVMYPEGYSGNYGYYNTSWYTEAEEIPRPNNWAWWNSISSGGKIGLSAQEWNAFCARINEFRAYKAMSSYNFTSVYSGMSIQASIMNEARNAISAISGHGTLPSSVSSGTVISAAFFTTLANALNSIS